MSEYVPDPATCATPANLTDIAVASLEGDQLVCGECEASGNMGLIDSLGP